MKLIIVASRVALLALVSHAAMADSACKWTLKTDTLGKTYCVEVISAPDCQKIIETSIPGSPRTPAGGNGGYYPGESCPKREDGKSLNTK